jgi:hypothetical protein
MGRRIPKKHGATKFAAGKADDFSPELWRLLDQAENREDKLKAVLGSLPKADIIKLYKEFHRAKRCLWKASNDWDFLRPKAGESISEDEKEDMFAYVVGQGREYYNEIMAHPEQLRRDVDPGEVPFLWVVGRVFWERFDEEITRQ